MKIGIDARLYGTKHGGIGRYTQELITQLERIDLENQYVVFLQKENFDDYKPQNKNFMKTYADFRPYTLGEQLFFPKILKKYNLDLVHFTHFNVPMFYRRKFILTIHDLIISHYPDSRASTLNPILYKIKLFFYDLVLASAARRAQKIIAVSEFTKNDVTNYLKVNPEKIVVTYEGVNFPAISEEGNKNILVDLGITGDYLLYVGSAYPHKNLERLVLAFSRLIENTTNLQLVLVGGESYFYERLKSYAAKFNFGARLIFAGYRSDAELVQLYKNAKLYVFPSLIEGFGLPPLEAQYYGLPVVSSKNSCLPEILGEAAVYFDPENVEEMVEAIKRVLFDATLQHDLIERGLINLRKYSWEKCARETGAVYFNQ